MFSVIVRSVFLRNSLASTTRSRLAIHRPWLDIQTVVPLILVLGLVLGTANRARAGFIDGFEGSTLNPFWNGVQQVSGTIATSPDLPHTGNQS